MLEPLLVALFPFAFLIILFGGGFLFRRRNIDMDGSPPIGRAVFYISKYSILLMWIAVIVQSWGVNMSLIEGPGALKWIALGFWVVGFLLLLVGRLGLGDSFRIGTPKESTGLKVDGLFHFSRNPMYVGVYSTLLAAVLYTLNPLVLVVAVYVIAVHHKIVLAEEAHLRQVFGEAYSSYCRRVRRYL